MRRFGTMMQRVLCVALFLLCTACYDRGFTEPEEQEPHIPATLSMAELNLLIAPESEGGAVTLTGEVTVEGTVTAVNQSGNLYGSLCVESDGAAVIVRTDISHLYTRYPVGCRVILCLQGLALGRFYGALEAGLPIAPDDYHPVGLIATPATLGGVVIRQVETLNGVVPTTVSIAELRADQCGTLVRIEQLRCRGTESGTLYWGDEPTLVDPLGYEIKVQVSASADFAGQALPTDEPLTLTGILYRNRTSGGYLLRPRDRADCGSISPNS